MWKLLSRPPYRSGSAYCDALLERGYRISDWIIDVASRLDFQADTFEFWPVPLTRVAVSQFGFAGPVSLRDFYEAAHEQGFRCASPEIALALRLEYDEQPIGEWLRVATGFDQMIDSDGVPHLPKLGSALGRLYLETYWAYPNAVFHPHNEFVMVERPGE